MAKVMLLCGKICSGKTTYCNRLREKERAVLLSCDEVESRLFHQSLGDRHDAVAADIKGYLRQKAAEIAAAGCNVVLDWGFWTRQSRSAARAFFREAGVPCRLYYLEIDDAALRCNIAHRNARVRRGETRDYFVDEGLFQKMKARFEAPEEGEIDRILRGKPGDMPGEAGKECRA